MKYQLVVHPKAEADLRYTFEWYEEQEKGLGGEFLRCVDAAISHINRSPKMLFLIYKDIRRSLIRRFPYGIFYVLEENKIVVLAVLHVRQHPVRWQKRK